MTFSTLVIMVALYLLKLLNLPEKPGKYEVEGGDDDDDTYKVEEVWYEEWSRSPGSVCRWPPKTWDETMEEWAHTPGAHCTWPPKYEDGRTPGHGAPYKEEQ